MDNSLVLLVASMLIAPLALFAGETKEGIDWEDGGGKSQAGPDDAQVQPGPSALPRVLIIGDSISIGYTKPVREYLNGKAEVHRPAENCMDSGHGVRTVSKWLGTDKWDVIHFNFGIWDTHYLDRKTGSLIRDESKVTLDQVRIRTTARQYRSNLKKIIAILKSSGARLVFATTTPVMYRKGARFEDIATLNEIAVEVMKEEGIAVNDLYGPVLKNEDTWLGPDRVHMADKGNEQLAELVGKQVLAAIGR